MLNEAVFALAQQTVSLKLAYKHHPYTNQFKINRNLVLLSPTSTGPPCVPPLGVLAQVHGGSRGAPLLAGSFCFCFACEDDPLKLPVQPAASGRLDYSKPFALPPPGPNHVLRRPAATRLRERMTALWDGGSGELSPFLLLRSA